MTRTRLKAILVSHYGAARHASRPSPCFSGSYFNQRLQGHSTPRRSTRIQGRATGTAGMEASRRPATVARRKLPHQVGLQFPAPAGQRRPTRP